MVTFVGIKKIRKMNLSQFGEFGFIENINKLFKGINSGKYEGIGDDCAVIPISDTQSFVVTTDLLVENKHFLRKNISPYDLGWKSLAVNISDVASMGAKPFASFMSIALPKNISAQWSEEFTKGYYDISKIFSTELLGGDTTSSTNDVVINVCAMGIIENSNIKRRKDAKAGDYIVVSSSLGESACGLKLFLENIFDKENPSHKFLEQRHHHPIPHVNEGKWIGTQKIGAMMDISDGVSSDIQHICKASNVGAKIYCDKLPFGTEFIEVCTQQNWDKNTLALSGGEDYSLLMTIPKENFTNIAEQYNHLFDRDLRIIGEITNTNKIEYFEEETQIDIPCGFRHF